MLLISTVNPNGSRFCRRRSLSGFDSDMAEEILEMDPFQRREDIRPALAKAQVNLHWKLRKLADLINSPE